MTILRRTGSQGKTGSTDTKTHRYIMSERQINGEREREREREREIERERERDRERERERER